MVYEGSDKCSLFIDNKLIYEESSKELFYSWHADLLRPRNTNTHIAFYIPRNESLKSNTICNIYKTWNQNKYIQQNMYLFKRNKNACYH